MTYITLDCRDGVHSACVVCNCECHFNNVIKPLDLDTGDDLYYTPRHRGKESIMTNASVRLSLMALAVIGAAVLIVSLIVWLY